MRVIVKIVSIAVLFFSAASTAVTAGGFGDSFGGPMGRVVSAKSLATNYARLSSRQGYARTQNYAKVGQYSINGGAMMKGYAEAGNKVDVRIIDKNAKVKVEQKSVAKTKLYLKGKNILAKAYAKNSLKLYVEGKLAFENEEYAYSMGRFTPLGTQMRSGATSHNKLEAKGLVRLSTGQIVVSSGQVGK